MKIAEPRNPTPPARQRVVEAQQQAQDGGLAAARGADHRQRLAAWHGGRRGLDTGSCGAIILEGVPVAR